ncbi:hypothetical protein PC116_g20133 [Phytophthora cactorum]|uniref:Uncharacterized protein n=1 Tax=Phytophthora cactorum TaxID=29920 RepID=A0A329RD95_9STRA|nr:hypothetical protein PC115_g17891 [Phytophthora cactorum]KAG2918467.1 hypothetical protein PC117_g17065 [Phytophthora cactorum]KAG2991516.1 hypothetical protein PC119_g18875 [Phytophthora cactorum]KAG3051638.1 hypothetical protein PC121_g17763 [Phytophthora cactorum]KAG3138733.1 hypothetical protein C6341_g20572 [Phytophthora cactorum]
MAEPTQRKNFSEAVDGMLLKQTIADEPYKQEHDKVMKQWDRVLETAANKKNTAAKRLSGVTESHSEKDQLLDELIWLSARQKDGQEEAKERANPSK